MGHKLTTCTFCGVGCGLYLEADGTRINGVYPSMSHPTNEGKICVRGWNVHEVASSPERLKHPLLRKNGTFRQVSWEEAFDFVAGRIREILASHGPDALAFLNSPRCSNEESYLFQKLARAVVGTNNVDHGTGVYCNNSIQILLDMIGAPAATNSVSELRQSEVIIVDGVDLGRQLPTIGGCVIRSKLGGSKLFVIDTRRHRVAESADIFLQIKPGTEVQFYGAMAKVIVDRGLMNLPFIRAHCRGYDAFLKEVRDYDLLQIAKECGVPAESVEATALAFARAKSAAILYSTGIETRRKDAIRAIVNLTLLTGQIGKPGAGLFPLTEHNNLQGVCDMGMLPDRLPGYRPVADAAARAAMEPVWKTKPPATPGVGARSIFDGNHGGRIKMLWLLRYDAVTTEMFGNVRKSLEACDLVVAQHLFMTETAQYAHVVLPLAAFGEERVTFTSTERRIQIADSVIDLPLGPPPAWQQLTQLGRLLGADWDYRSASDIMDEIGQVVPFYSGANYENLGREYGRQWPCTKDRPLGTGTLFADSIAPGAFKFAPVARPATAVKVSSEFPFTVVFGNSLFYWHRNSLVRRSETLKREHRILLLDYPEGFVEINTGDAEALGIRDGGKVRLRGAHGSAVAAARVTHEVKSGTVLVPFFVRDVQKQIVASETEDLLESVCLEKITE